MKAISQKEGIKVEELSVISEMIAENPEKA